MLFIYARGGEIGWALGFVALVPWLRTLDAGPAAASLARTLLSGWLMSVALTAAMFAWFGFGMARYLDVPGALGLGVLLALAPVFQPQVWVFALVRHLARRAAAGRAAPEGPAGPDGRGEPLPRSPARPASPHGARGLAVALAAMAGSAAWVATEWAWPKLLGDTLGHGLYPSALLRQAADLGGAAGLTLLLLLANEAVTAAWAGVAARGAGGGVRAVARPLALAVAVPLALAAYGAASPTAAPEPAAPAAQRLRMGLVQSNIVDYERLRRERGPGAVVREVLDVHYAMSYDAVERQKAQALLWSETVYPTTFGRPKSEAGAELDREIAGIVDAAGVPLVFGTYDREGEGAAGREYNAAAFLAPGTGLVGVYRKTRLFPFTEALPAWLDGPGLGPLVRGALPWAGAWHAGDGARVFPLRLADGREVPVLPLICLDDVDTRLAVEGARLGALLILTMSNDSWFTDHPQGAQLHLAVAAFRSIETRLPQFRVTNNGFSAVLDARGEVLAGTRMGERTLVVGELTVREPSRTLMVAWGDWVGRAAALFLLVLAMPAAMRAWRRGRAGAAREPAHAAGAAYAGGEPPPPAQALDDGRTGAGAPAGPMPVAVLTPSVRWVAAALRTLAFGSLLGLALAVLMGEGALAANTLAQVRAFAALVLAPELAARVLLWASRATLSVQGGRLVLERGGRRFELAVDEVAAVRAWRVPSPLPGASLRLAAGGDWGHALGGANPVALQRALAAARGAAALPQDGAPQQAIASPRWAAAHAQAALAPRGPRFLQHALTKFVGLPFLLAVPAFRLHQHIAFGGGLGELQLFGLAAFAKGFLLWWAAWGIGVVIVAAVLRALVELGTYAAVLVQPAEAVAVRGVLDRFALAVLYLGIPAWFAWRLLGG